MHRVFCAPSRYVQGEGAPERLAVEMAELGLPAATAADHDAIATRATQAGETIHNLPRPVTAADFAAAIRAADERAAEIAGRK